MDCDDESTCCGYDDGPESAELVDGLCSCRKFGISGAANESRRFLWTPITLGGGTPPVWIESRLEPRLLESPDPRLEPLRVDDCSTDTETFGISWFSFSLVPSLLFQIFANSDVCESLLDLMLLIPESALDSRRFRRGGACCGVEVYWSLLMRCQGKLLAKSANVSRRFKGGFWLRFVPVPLHSRRISVNWASELRRRLRLGGGEVLGGDWPEICAAESRRPPKRCRIVDSHS